MTRSTLSLGLFAVVVSAFASVGCIAQPESSDDPGDDLASISEDEAVGEAEQALGGYSLGSLAASYVRDKSGVIINVPWTAPAGHATSDWIAMYKVGGVPNYQYLGFHNVGTAATSGTMQFNVGIDGDFEFRYLLNGGYQSAASSTAFNVHPLTVCRGLNAGDSYYPAWTSCCDSADANSSFWTNASDPNYTHWYSGSCYWLYGINP